VLFTGSDVVSLSIAAFNEHNWLASKLKECGVAYEMLDNAFLHIADYARANQLANEFAIETLLQYYSSLLEPPSSARRIM
jgi:hypothetical protein